MAFLGIFGNYDKPGPGVNKDEPPKAAPVRFFEIFFRKFSKLIQLNLIFVIPTIIAFALMIGIYFAPTHFILQLPTMQLDVWTLYAVPFPLVFLSPFLAGLTFVTRNFAREEHAFIWSDFWSAVKSNWKYFLINGFICYLAYLVLSFSMIYYYNQTAQEWLFYIPFWLCIVLAVLFVFAQYYLPIMFVTFDLKFGQAYKNAFIFALAGFWRNILLTVIVGGLGFLAISVVPIMGLTILIFLLLFLLLIFSFTSYLINFTVYPMIDRYLIQPYEQKLEDEKNGPKEVSAEEEKFPGLFSPEPEENDGEDGQDKLVYMNGKLVKKSELDNPKNDDY